MMVVAYLNPGDFVGEMGLFDDEVPVRSAMVMAKTQCEVAEISYERFHQIRNQFPDILYAISRQISTRLRLTTRKLTDLAFVDVSGPHRPHPARPVQGTRRHDPSRRHADQDHPPGAGQDRRLLPEMAGRVLKTLEENGLVSVSGKTMVVYGTR